jgi:hypothetical protein
VFLACACIVYCLRRRRARREKRYRGPPVSKERIGRPSEPMLAPSLAALEADANDKFSVGGPTTRDSQASTVGPQQRLGDLSLCSLA